MSYANNVAEAVAAFDEHEIGIIISNMRVGNVDATRMLKLLKQQHPDIVAVVYTGATDAVDVIGLINQAQIFRFINKPWKFDELLQVVNEAASIGIIGPTRMFYNRSVSIIGQIADQLSGFMSNTRSGEF